MTNTNEIDRGIIKDLKELWLASRGWEFPMILDHLLTIDFFDYLEEPKTFDSIINKFKFENSKFDAVLRVLISRGIIKETNNQYFNSELANQYLISKSKDYFGHYVKWKVKDSINWKNNFGKVLFGNQHIVHGDSIYEGYTDNNQDSLEGILVGCSLYSSDDFAKLVSTYKPKGSLLDLGCGSGIRGFKISELNPKLNLLLLDRTTEYAKKILENRYLNLKDKTKIIKQDFFESTFLPKAETVVIANLLMDWKDNDVDKIVNKVVKESKPEVLFIHEFILEEDSVSAGYNVLANFETFGRVRNKEFWNSLLSKYFSQIEFVKMNFGSYAIVCSRKVENEK